VGVARRPAIIDVEISIVETADKSKLIAKAIVKKSTGNDAWGYDFDTGYRIEKAYSRCAQKFAKFMFKNGLK
jgi:hypothetical protein